MQDRIIAEFVPQAWINGYTVNVDPEGETEFDVTDAVLAMGREKALALRDDRDETDLLRHVKTAPKWISDWRGPFYVRVEDAIAAYYERDSSNVFHIDSLDDEHRGAFERRLPGKPWLFDCDYEAIRAFATEDEACAAQREYRAAHGYDPMTGERV